MTTTRDRPDRQLLVICGLLYPSFLRSFVLPVASAVRSYFRFCLVVHPFTTSYFIEFFQLLVVEVEQTKKNRSISFFHLRSRKRSQEHYSLVTSANVRLLSSVCFLLPAHSLLPSVIESRAGQKERANGRAVGSGRAERRRRPLWREEIDAPRPNFPLLPPPLFEWAPFRSNFSSIWTKFREK